MLSLESRVPPPAIVVAIGVIMWLISRVAPGARFDVPPYRWFGVAVIAIGFVTSVSGVVTFLRARTTLNPIRLDASSLVTCGVYAVSRNPMYLGGLIVLLGWGLVLLNVLALACLPA